MASPMFRLQCASRLWLSALALLTAIALTQVSCASSPVGLPDLPSLELSSTSFHGPSIPKICTCDGGEKSPELSWNAPPVNTRTLALIAIDRDSPLSWLIGPFVHWLIYNLPANKMELPEGIPSLGQLPDGSLQGLNGFGKIGYAGPCAPPPSSHRYAFTLYALDTRLDLPSGASREQVQQLMNGHILARGEVVARYHRGWLPPVILVSPATRAPVASAASLGTLYGRVSVPALACGTSCIVAPWRLWQLVQPAPR